MIRMAEIMTRALISTSSSPQEERAPATFIGANMAIEMGFWAHPDTWRWQMNRGQLYRLLRKGNK